MATLFLSLFSACARNRHRLTIQAQRVPEQSKVATRIVGYAECDTPISAPGSPGKVEQFCAFGGRKGVGLTGYHSRGLRSCRDRQ